MGRLPPVLLAYLGFLLFYWFSALLLSLERYPTLQLIRLWDTVFLWTPWKHLFHYRSFVNVFDNTVVHERNLLEKSGIH